MRPIVVYATRTFHVLGALTLTGPARTPPDLTGADFPLWAGGDDGVPIPLTVPRTELGQAVVADQPGLHRVPLAFGVQEVNGVPRPDLRLLQPGDPSGGPLLPPSGNVTVGLAAAEVTVTLPADAEADLEVLLVVGGAGGTQRSETGQVPKGEREKRFRMNLSPGSYAALALVETWRGVVHQATI
ncbi:MULTISPECIES: hypothetical protein [Actinoplanes]|uniref:hypothetical protein n=1 Tax=Actinoplanes TaxID=1865 RepID=UPI0005F2B9E8|nr:MULTISPECIES: hypothetical protein [Actinoplanes]GLY05341.1 hypothetical protein Acsp01_57200 [Actinoplanes sp. NBRC 101535]